MAKSTGTSFGTPRQWMSGHGVGSNARLMADINGDLKADAIVFFSVNGAWWAARALEDSPAGYYYFRASGFDVNGSGSPIAVLSKLVNGLWQNIATAAITAPPMNEWYVLKVEAVGSSIRAYLDGEKLIDVVDHTFTRGHVGIKVHGSASHSNFTPSAYYFGGYDSESEGIRIYGTAQTTYTYSAEGLVTGINSALATESRVYDHEVHGWSAQVPEQRFSIRTDPYDPANNVIYGDSRYGPSTIWTGDISWTNYTVEATVRFTHAGAPDDFWGVGGSAGIVIRSSGNPERGYYVGLTPNGGAGLYLVELNGVNFDSHVVLDSATTTTTTSIGQEVRLKVEVSSNPHNGNLRIRVWWDDNSNPINYICTTNCSEKYKNGKVGLRVTTARAIFDDVKITGPDGKVWRFDDFQAKGLLTGKASTDKVSGLPSGETIQYDESGRPYSITDKNKQRLTVTRDERGNIIAQADPSGTVTLKTYDVYGQVISETISMQPSYNYVPDPSFENGSDWELKSRDTSTVEIEASDQSYHGGNSLKLTYNYLNGQGGVTDWIGAHTSKMPVKAGGVYTVSAHVKSSNFLHGTSISDGKQHHHVYVRFWTAGANPTIIDQIGAEIPECLCETDWQQIYKTVTVPDTAEFAEVFVAIVGSFYGQSIVWVDAVQLQEGAVVPETNLLKNPGAEKLMDGNPGTPEGWSSNFPGGTSGQVGGIAPSSNWQSLPSSWSINDQGQMSVLFWKGKEGTSNETVLRSAAEYEHIVSWDPITIQADIQMNTGRDVGLAFDTKDNGNMYLIRASGMIGDKDNPSDPGETHFKTALWIKQGGDWTKLTSGNNYNMTTSGGQALLPEAGSWYTLVVSVAANTVSWHYIVDGASSLTYVYNGNPLASNSGRVGIRTGEEHGYSQQQHNIDNVQVSHSINSFNDTFNAHNPYFIQSHNGANTASSWSQTLTGGRVTPGQNYTLSARLWTESAPDGDGPGGARLRVVWKSGSTVVGEDYSPLYQTGGEWAKRAITLAAPEGAGSAVIYLEQVNFEGETRFDDIRFEPNVGLAGFSALGNGSFETISGDKPAGWTWSSSTDWAKDTKIYKFGKTSVRVSSPTAKDHYATQTVKVKPNTTYMFSGWIRTAAVAAVRGHGAVIFAISGGSLYKSVPVIGDSDWSLQTVVFTTGPATTSITVGMQLGHGGPSSGVAWFDGLELVEKSAWTAENIYDSYGNLIGSFGPTGAESRMGYDAAGRL
ncbi:MAG: hypothetical protein IBX61_09505, partial [Thermoleophilia bacterium]|nr:hypothetical protein [Thermoleophilia bacterium]